MAIVAEGAISHCCLSPLFFMQVLLLTSADVGVVFFWHWWSGQDCEHAVHKPSPGPRMSLPHHAPIPSLFWSLPVELCWWLNDAQATLVQHFSRVVLVSMVQPSVGRLLQGNFSRKAVIVQASMERHGISWGYNWASLNVQFLIFRAVFSLRHNFLL